jgi:mono/diheme cytochrome c family protein
MKPGIFVTLSALTLAGGSLARAAEFQEVQDIFSRRCKECHMEGKSKGHLSLEAEKIARKIGDKEPIVPGEPDKSNLVKVLLLKEGDDDRMPPKGPPLSEAEIGAIKSWISEGAKLPDKKDKQDKEKADAKPEPASAPEMWTSTSGSSITAALMRVDAVRKVIVLKKEDGTTMEVPISKLDEDSKARAKSFWEKNK